ncbi:hypothetical protein T484DRAFT_1784287 [Baffinella frigidus]|nr:hypothetical protein T484DRAFT_1784287 [Cryptophyta sp. CCMP2293]
MCALFANQDGMVSMVELIQLLTFAEIEYGAGQQPLTRVPIETLPTAALTYILNAFYHKDTNRDGLISSDEAPAWPYGLSVQDLTSSDAQTLFTTMDMLFESGTADAPTIASMYGGLVAGTLAWVMGQGELTEEHQVAFYAMMALADMDGTADATPSLSLGEAARIGLSLEWMAIADLNCDLMISLDEFVVGTTYASPPCNPSAAIPSCNFTVLSTMAGEFATTLPTTPGHKCSLLVLPGVNYPAPFQEGQPLCLPVREIEKAPCEPNSGGCDDADNATGIPTPASTRQRLSQDSSPSGMTRTSVVSRTHLHPASMAKSLGDKTRKASTLRRVAQMRQAMTAEGLPFSFHGKALTTLMDERRAAHKHRNDARRARASGAGSETRRASLAMFARAQKASKGPASTPKRARATRTGAKLREAGLGAIRRDKATGKYVRAQHPRATRAVRHEAGLKAAGRAVRSRVLGAAKVSRKRAGTRTSHTAHMDAATERVSPVTAPYVVKFTKPASCSAAQLLAKMDLEFSCTSPWSVAAMATYKMTGWNMAGYLGVGFMPSDTCLTAGAYTELQDATLMFINPASLQNVVVQKAWDRIMQEQPDSLSFLAVGGVQATLEIFKSYIEFLGVIYPDGVDQLRTWPEIDALSSVWQENPADRNMDYMTLGVDEVMFNLAYGFNDSLENVTAYENEFA